MRPDPVRSACSQRFDVCCRTSDQRPCNTDLACSDPTAQVRGGQLVERQGAWVSMDQDALQDHAGRLRLIAIRQIQEPAAAKSLPQNSRSRRQACLARSLRFEQRPGPCHQMVDEESRHGAQVALWAPEGRPARTHQPGRSVLHASEDQFLVAVDNFNEKTN